jgi:hypothetical protein
MIDQDRLVVAAQELMVSLDDLEVLSEAVRAIGNPVTLSEPIALGAARSNHLSR